MVPKSLRFVRRLTFSNLVYALCPSSDLQYCFVGLEGGNVAQMDADAVVKEDFASMGVHVNGLCQTDGKLYGLSFKFAGNYSFKCVNLNSGNHEIPMKENHLCGGRSILKVACTSKEIIAPQPDLKQLCVYNFGGVFQRAISIPSLRHNNIGMATGCDCMIVVTDKVNVYMVNTASGEIAWTVTNIDVPGAVSFHNDEVVMVADSKKKVVMLDICTGTFSNLVFW